MNAQASHKSRRLRPGRMLLGGLLVVPLALLLLLGSNLWTYSRLSHEAPVADLEFRQIGDHRYQVRLRRPDGSERRLVLEGDQWQLDARVIKWKPWANLLGLDASWRLERIAGRHADPARARRGPVTLYQLAPSGVLDAWTLARRHAAWLPLFDSAYGSSVYLPMGDRLAYHVSISQTGLLARPIPPDEQGAGD